MALLRRALAGLVALCVALGALAQVSTNPTVTNICPPLTQGPTGRNRGPGECEQLRFYAALQTSLVPGIALGSPTPTFTRATAADQIDFEGLHHQVLSGEVRFQGARRVRNHIGNSGDLTVATGGWSKSANMNDAVGGAADPDGGTTAYTLTASGGNGQWYRSPNTLTAGGSVRSSIFIRRRTGSGTVSIIPPNNVGLIDITASLSSSWQRFASTVTAPSAGTNAYLGLQINTAGDAVDVWHPLLSDVTGQTNQNPSEYVSVGVLSAPYHGAGVDGVKYFDTLNGNTVASNVVTEATGAHIDSSQSAAAGGVTAGVVDAVGPRGYLAEGAGTQILATADIRDMTTASWTLGATMTRARTSVGADGGANSATRLTAGAVAATNIITTTITAAATSRTYSALVRRVTGTGVIRLTQDNFATNTDVTASVPSDGFYHLVQLNQSQLNAVMGFKLDTNGDAIDVDFNQFEAGGFATSRMAATGAARNADVLTYPNVGNFNDTQGSAYAEFVYPPAATGVNSNVIGVNNAYPLYINLSQFKVGIFDGTNAVLAGSDVRGAGIVKGASSWGGASIWAVSNGSTASGAFDGSMGASTAITIGGGSSLSINGTIRNVRIYDRPLSTGRLQGMTQ